MKFLAGSLLSALALASPLNALEFEFMKWISNHNRSYSTLEEYSMRKLIWAEHDEFIKMVNNPENEFTHTAGHNKFSDWTEEEFEALMTEKEPINQENNSPHVVSDEPILKYGNIDWRTTGCVNAV